MNSRSALFLGTWTLAVLSSAVVAEEQSKISVRFELTTEVSQHEPVVLRYTLENHASSEVQVNLGYDRIEAFGMSLLGPAGERQRVRVNIYSRPYDHGSRLPVVKLSPFATYTQSIVLNEWFKFDKTGPYELTVQLDGRIMQAGVTFPPIAGATPGPFKIWQRPRDEATLRARCEALVGLLTSSRAYDEVTTGARNQLALIYDPVAVPYLERAIAAEVGPDFFKTLLAIGDASAKEAVIRLTQHPSTAVSANAKSILPLFKTRRRP